MMQEISDNNINTQTGTAKHKLSAPMAYYNPFKKDKNIGVIILFCAIVAVTIFMFSILIFTNLVSLCLVRQDSMNPTIQDGQFVLLRNTNRNIQRGDVVTLEAPVHHHPRITLFIKRVVAVGGDTIKFKTSDRYETEMVGNVVVGRTFIVDMYISPVGSNYFARVYEYEEGIILQPMLTTNFYNLLVDGVYTHYVPYGHVYVLGDNRRGSLDSRRYGSFNLSVVTGRMTSVIRQGSSRERFLLFIFGSPREAGIT